MPYHVSYGGYNFVLEYSERGAHCLTVYPMTLGEDDIRSVIVTRTVDTETGESDFSMHMPRMQDGEHEMWAAAISAAGTFMAMKEGGTMEGTEGLLFVDTDDDDNVVISLPSGHKETLTPEQAEGLAFELLATLKEL